MSFFSKNIRFLRTKNGLNQAEMLSKLGIPRTTWSSYENGVSQPDINGLIKISHFFEISVTELVENDLENDKEYGKPIHKKKQKRESNVRITTQKATSITDEILIKKQMIIENQTQIMFALQSIVDRLTEDITRLEENVNVNVKY